MLRLQSPMGSLLQLLARYPHRCPAKPGHSSPKRSPQNLLSSSADTVYSRIRDRSASRMSAKLHCVQSDESSTKGWRKMARRTRGQFPQPRKENKLWKIRYWADVAQPDGTIKRKKRTKCLGRVEEMTLTQARKEAQRFLQPINDVEAAIEHTEKTMNDLIAQWRTLVKPNLKLSTQLSYEWAFKHIQRTFGPLAVSEIEKAGVQAFLTAASRGLAPESVRDLRARLRGVLTLAEEWGWLKMGSNPAAGRLRLPGRIRTRAIRIPTPSQFRTLVLALPQPYRVIVCLAGLGGLRRGELAALRWDDFQSRTVVVDEAVYRGALDTPKSLKSKRTVTIPVIAVKLVENWRSQCPFRDQKDFAFSIRTNSPIDLNRAIERKIKPAAEALGLPRFSWHDFRHAYTTWGRNAGVEAEIIRDQVGHASVLMTQDVYSHLDDREGAADKIGRYVWPDESEDAA